MKHIAINNETKERIGEKIPKNMFWDNGINAICDFLDKHSDEFSEFVKNRQKE